MAIRYYVTVLSNFARGYDKYARSYSKGAISESRFPEQFFLLRRDDLKIGVEKGQKLLEKLALKDNCLLAIETAVEESALHDNLKTGLGQYVESGAIGVQALSVVDLQSEGWRLSPISVEEAMARSLRVLHGNFPPFAELAPRSLSILPIAQGCQAACPFCFSDASVSAVQEQAKLKPADVAMYARAAKDRGAERFVITGGGEPGLVPHERLLDYISVGSAELGKTVLITNGHHLSKLSAEERTKALVDYSAAGLRVLAISCHHHDEEKNGQLMSLRTPVAQIAATWKVNFQLWPRLRLRLTCVLQKGGVENLAGLEAYVDWAASIGVAEVCFKELYVSTSMESVYHDREANLWSEEHQIPLALVLELAARHHLKESSRLPWGAPVFSGTWKGKPMQIAAYTEPSLFWELSNGIARSWNVMADGRCLVSLEDRGSEIPLGAAP